MSNLVYEHILKINSDTSNISNINEYIEINPKIVLNETLATLQKLHENDISDPNNITKFIIINNQRLSLFLKYFSINIVISSLYDNLLSKDFKNNFYMVKIPQINENNLSIDEIDIVDISIINNEIKILNNNTNNTNNSIKLFSKILIHHNNLINNDPNIKNNLYLELINIYYDFIIFYILFNIYKFVKNNNLNKKTLSDLNIIENEADIFNKLDIILSNKKDNINNIVYNPLLTPPKKETKDISNILIATFIIIVILVIFGFISLFLNNSSFNMNAIIILIILIVIVLISIIIYYINNYNVENFQSSPVIMKFPRNAFTSVDRNKIKMSSYWNGDINSYPPELFFNNNTNDAVGGSFGEPNYVNGVVKSQFTYFANYPGEYLMVNIGEQFILNQIKLWQRTNIPTRTPGIFRIYGTNDINLFNTPSFVGWDLVYNQTTKISSSNPQIYNIYSTTPYSIYCLVVNQLQGTGSTANVLNFVEWELYGTPKPVNYPLIIHNNIIEQPYNLDSDYDYFIFSSTTGTNSITFDKDYLCDIVLVGGGGGGSHNHGGGGGAGGIIVLCNAHVNAGKYNIIVGSGGYGGKTTNNINTYGLKGGDTSFDIYLTAEGGGGGGQLTINSTGNGGSGGGSDAYNPITSFRGKALIPVNKTLNGTIGTYYGFDGGDKKVNETAGAGGGGGGAGSIGSTPLELYSPANGGFGIYQSINNSKTINFKNAFNLGINANNYGEEYNGNVYFGGGGGNGNWALQETTGGSGGIGGGGKGGRTIKSTGNTGADLTGRDGLAYSGGGGGGGGDFGYHDMIASGGRGGSGIIMIRWRKTPLEQILTEPVVQQPKSIPLDASKLILQQPSYRPYTVINQSALNQQEPKQSNIIDQSYIREQNTEPEQYFTENSLTNPEPKIITKLPITQFTSIPPIDNNYFEDINRNLYDIDKKNTYHINDKSELIKIKTENLFNKIINYIKKYNDYLYNK